MQRSFLLLEERYRELHETGQKHFEAWETEIAELKQLLSAQSAQLQEAQQERDQQAERVTFLEAELGQLRANLAIIAQAVQRMRQLNEPPTT